MTIYGWDASHYDAPPTKRDGIDFYTHKCAEGHHSYKDAEYQAAMAAARSLGVPVLGAYYVNHPGTVADQADWWVSIVERETPWWRDVPFIWQIDAEKFSYMSRAPNLAEINALGDLICQRAKVPASSVLAYAPKWLYGDGLKGLRYRLWASSYGSNPTVAYRDAYPGDTSSRWAAYSGQTPVILQYGSRTTIAGQTTCDANAFRGTLAQLQGLLGSKGTDDMAFTETQMRAFPWQYVGGGIPTGYSALKVFYETWNNARETKAKVDLLVTAVNGLVSQDLDGDLRALSARFEQERAEADVQFAELLAAVGQVDDEVWAKLGSAEVTTEQKAELLRQWLGDDAVAVGALLAPRG